MYYLEFRDENLEKFWEADVVGLVLFYRYGKVGAKGQSRSQLFETPAEAVAEVDALVAEKRKLGYIDAKLGSKKNEKNQKSENVIPNAVDAIITAVQCEYRDAFGDMMWAVKSGEGAKQKNALQALRILCESSDNLEWNVALFSYLTEEFVSSREIEITTEHKKLQKRIAASKEKEHLAKVEYLHAFELFAKHGAAQEKKVREHLVQTSKFFPWYDRTLGHIDTGIACEKALKERDYARLFYLQIHEVIGASHSVSVSPWMMRATTNPNFSAWVLKQKTAPEVPDDLKLPKNFNPSSFSYWFFHQRDGWADLWPTGLRELGASLILLSDDKVPDVSSPFYWAARRGDLDALRFFFSRGDCRFMFSTLLGYPIRVSVLDQLIEWGLTPEEVESGLARQLSNIYSEREVYERLLSAGANANTIYTGEQYLNGKMVEFQQSFLHYAADKSCVHGIEALLAAGADPTHKNSFRRSPAECASTSQAYELLSNASGAYSMGDALRYVAANTSITDVENRIVVKMIAYNGGLTTPLTYIFVSKGFMNRGRNRKSIHPGSPLMRLAKALVGAGSSKIEKEKNRHFHAATVVESSLNVDGKLTIDNDVLVLGDLVAEEISIGEFGALAVAGNVTAKSVHCGGQLHVAGNLDSVLVTAFDYAKVGVTHYKVGLSVFYAHCGLDAEKIDGPHYNFAYEVEADDDEYIELVSCLPESCVSKTNGDFGVLGVDFLKLSKLALSGKLKLKK